MKLISAVLWVVFANVAAVWAQPAQSVCTLQTFGIAMDHGRIVHPLPSNVALGLFNPDPLLDVASYTDGKVRVYQNLGNGTFGTEPVWEMRARGEVEMMEWRKSRYLTEGIFDPNSWGDLVIDYVDGHNETISHEQMVRKSSALPAGGFGSLPPMSPPLSFTEVWRSEPNALAATYVQVGDIDNDGRTEVAYVFYDSTGNIGTLTVFENYGNDQYRIEWDSVMEAAPPFAITDIDNDGNKEIVVEYTIPGLGVIGFLECLGEGQFRFYRSNIGVDRPPFKVLQTDVDHDGINELTVLTSSPSVPLDETIIYVAEFVSKGPGPNGWQMAFNQQIARYQGYTFDMTVGQVDGQGWDEIIPAGGSFGYQEPVPVDYLWYSGVAGPELWKTRGIYTGLQSGTGAVMFVNLDADTTMEFVSGAPGPIGHGSMFALKYVSDTTWSVMWADSTLRNSPLWVNSGYLNGEFVVAGANSYNPNNDTIWSQLHAYHSSGLKVGLWFKDSASIQNFHLLDVDRDGRTNLIFPQVSHFIGHYLVDYESDTVVVSIDPPMGLPEQIELFQNYPNPFNPETRIKYQIPYSNFATLKVYDVLGRELATLVDEVKEPGTHEVTWDARGHASGVYFYRLRAGSFVLVRKMIVLK